MVDSDTLAARMRAEYVGEDAIAFDELKPEVRARWERVAAVACPAPTMTMEELLEDFNQFAERHNAGLRSGVPFTAALTAAVPERASDDELKALAIDAYNEGPECGYGRAMQAATIAVRARVEAPLLAEIQRLDIENRDRAFYVTEFAAVSQERDEMRAELDAVTDELAALRQPTPAPIAAPDVLEQLAKIAERAANVRVSTDGLHINWPEAVAAILRAAQAYVDVEAGWQLQATVDSFGLTRAAVDYLNSRIRYRVALPETPKWLPDIDHLEAIFDNTYGATKSDKKALEAVVTELRPWLHEPTGWELDVTAEEAADVLLRVADRDVTVRQATMQLLDLCRSRIRPTFEPCKRCAKLSEYRKIVLDGAEEVRNRIDAARAALGGE